MGPSASPLPTRLQELSLSRGSREHQDPAVVVAHVALARGWSPGEGTSKRQPWEAKSHRLMGRAPWQQPWGLARPPSPNLSCPEPAFPAHPHCQGSDWWGLFSTPGAWVGRVKTEKLVAIPSPPPPEAPPGPSLLKYRNQALPHKKRTDARIHQVGQSSFWTKLRWKPGRAWRGVLKSDALGGQQTVPEVLQAQRRAGLLPRGEQSNARVGRCIPDCLGRGGGEVPDSDLQGVPH